MMNGCKYIQRAAFALAMAGLLASSVPSHAYQMLQNGSNGRVTSGNLVVCSASGGFAHWTNRNIYWYHNASGQGAGQEKALSNATSSWTNVGASHVLTYLGAASYGWATDNRNTILWSTDNGCTGNCLALTALVLVSGQVIVESDITFNANYFWGPAGVDVESVAAHELGHSLGIHHTEMNFEPFPTMSATYFGVNGRTLEADDRAALQCSENRYVRTAGSTTCNQYSHAWVGGAQTTIMVGTTIYPTGVVRRNTPIYFNFVPRTGGPSYQHTTYPSRDNCVVHHEPEARSTAGWQPGLYDIYASYTEWETDWVVTKLVGLLDLYSPPPPPTCDPQQEADCWNNGGSWDSYSCTCSPQGGCEPINGLKRPPICPY